MNQCDEISPQEYLQDLIWGLQRSLYQITEEESKRQQRYIDEFTAANHTCRQELNRACTMHVETQQALERERCQHRRAAETLAQREQLLLLERAAHLAAKEALEDEKMQSRKTEAELDLTQRKLQLVDSLVDTMLLEEDSQLELPDRSRQVTDIILDLESQLEARYQSVLEEKESRIKELENMVVKLCAEADGSAPTLRSQSAPDLRL